MPRNRPKNYNKNNFVTPCRQVLTVPTGYIMAHIRWRGCNILKEIKKKLLLLYIEEGSIIDFHPSGKTAVLYLSESDIIGQTDFKARIEKLRRCRGFTTLNVIFEKTPMTESFMFDIQNLVVIELGMNIYHVANQTQGAELLVQMVSFESKTPGRNPFRKSINAVHSDANILETTKLLPGVGEKKAYELLHKFGSIKNIIEASSHDLKSVIGQAGQRLSEFVYKEMP